MLIQKKVQELGKLISQDYEGKELFAVILLKGAFIFAADLVREIKVDVVVDFIQVASYVGEKSSGEIRILKDLDENIYGRHVLIIEDILDTGLTLYEINRVLKNRNPKSLEICTLLNKPTNRKIEIDAKYIGFYTNII